MPQGMEGRVEKVEMVVGRVWDQRVAVVVRVRRDEAAEVNQLEAWGWWVVKGWEMKPVSMLEDSQWSCLMRLSVVWKRNDVLSRESLLASLSASMRAGRFCASSALFSRSLDSRRAGCVSRPQPGGKLAAPRVSVTDSMSLDHLMVRLRTPSLSSGMLVRSTQSRCFLGVSLPLSPFRNRTVPAGVHRPPDLSFSHPIASGTAPQSRRKWTRSEKSISAAGSLNSSSYCIL